ncbi:hypothetical protein TSUD_274230 [Trifolium subterraneum]|uniref:Uncharacterized protein n=1 Tax=Trifolium subterraneum TaxID=3900 RepID=A0A2Z6NKC1_TRISU|nr:hypothetical protein TSUD_274230 [Trifolium subterraneum]
MVLFKDMKTLGAKLQTSSLESFNLSLDSVMFVCYQGVLSWSGLIPGFVARVTGWNGKQVQLYLNIFPSFTGWYETPLPKPPVSAVLNPLLPPEPPNDLAIKSHSMSPPPLKPPDHNFQLKQEEFQETWEPSVPLPSSEPSNGDHIWMVLQGFVRLILPNLTGFRSLYHNGSSVTESILESSSVESEFVVIDVFDRNHCIMVSIVLSTGKLVHERSRSVAKGGIILINWPHMEKATSKSFYILSSLESALYVSFFMLESLRGVVSCHQSLAVKFGEQFHILRFDASIEGVGLRLFLTYFKPCFLEPSKPLKAERSLLVKEWILKAFANIWFCFNHKCTPLWNGHEQGIGMTYLPTIYYTSKDQLVIQKNYFIDLFNGSLAIGFSNLLMGIDGVTCVEEFESSIDADTHTLLELLEEFAMVPYLAMVPYFDIRVGPYINGLLELYNLLELFIEELEYIVDVNIHALLELLGISLGALW